MALAFTGARRTLPLLFAVAVLLRAAFVLHHAHLGWQLRFDPGYYLALAGHLRHGVFSLFHPQDIPDTTRMPGYPFLLHLAGSSIPMVLAVQVIVSALKVPLVHALARTMGAGDRPALWAAAFMAIAPMDIVLAGSVLTEAVFTTALLAGVLLAVRDRGRPSAAGAVLCFATAAWMRPNGLLLAALAALLMVVLLRHNVWRSALIAVGTLLLLSPWMLRHHRLTGRIGLSDNATMTAGYFHVPRVLAAAHDPRATGYRQELHARAAATDWTDREATARFFATLRADIGRTLREHPLAWARVHGGTMLRTLVAPGRGHFRMYFRHFPAVRYAMLTASAALMLLVLLGMAGLLIRARHAPRGLWVLMLLSIAMLFTAGITTPDARFREPAMPFLLVVAAWALERARSAVARTPAQ
jgi:hypothetical protein